MKLYIASDHAGFQLKEAIKSYVASRYPDYVIDDLGTNDETSVHYPEFGFKAAQALTNDDNPKAKGIIICGSGIGISIAANRVANARAALCMTPDMAKLAREHNNANILALGARLVGQNTAFTCVDSFFSTPFAGERHEMRVKMLG